MLFADKNSLAIELLHLTMIYLIYVLILDTLLKKLYNYKYTSLNYGIENLVDIIKVLFVILSWFLEQTRIRSF